MGWWTYKIESVGFGAATDCFQNLRQLELGCVWRLDDSMLTRFKAAHHTSTIMNGFCRTQNPGPFSNL